MIELLLGLAAMAAYSHPVAWAEACPGKLLWLPFVSIPRLSLGPQYMFCLIATESFLKSAWTHGVETQSSAWKFIWSGWAVNWSPALHLDIMSYNHSPGL